MIGNVTYLAPDPASHAGFCWNWDKTTLSSSSIWLEGCNLYVFFLQRRQEWVTYVTQQNMVWHGWSIRQNSPFLRWIIERRQANARGLGRASVTQPPYAPSATLALPRPRASAWRWELSFREWRACCAVKNPHTHDWRCVDKQNRKLIWLGTYLSSLLDLYSRGIEIMKKKSRCGWSRVLVTPALNRGVRRSSLSISMELNPYRCN